MYIVISMPNRKSIASGVSHFMWSSCAVDEGLSEATYERLAQEHPCAGPAAADS
jgi:hypothetical protein